MRSAANCIRRHSSAVAHGLQASRSTTRGVARSLPRALRRRAAGHRGSCGCLAVRILIDGGVIKRWVADRRGRGLRRLPPPARGRRRRPPTSCCGFASYISLLLIVAPGVCLPMRLMHPDNSEATCKSPRSRWVWAPDYRSKSGNSAAEPPRGLEAGRKLPQEAASPSHSFCENTTNKRIIDIKYTLRMIPLLPCASQLLEQRWLLGTHAPQSAATGSLDCGVRYPRTNARQDPARHPSGIDVIVAAIAVANQGVVATDNERHLRVTTKFLNPPTP